MFKMCKKKIIVKFRDKKLFLTYFDNNDLFYKHFYK